MMETKHNQKILKLNWYQNLSHRIQPEKIISQGELILSTAWWCMKYLGLPTHEKGVTLCLEEVNA